MAEACAGCAGIGAASKLNLNVDGNATAYKLALEQDIFRDVFEEVDGNDEGQATMQQYVDGDGEEKEIDMNAFKEDDLSAVVGQLAMRGLFRVA